MSAGEAKTNASTPAVDAEARRVAGADELGELRQLLLRFAAEIGQTFSLVRVAFANYPQGGSAEVSAEWRQKTASLFHEALTQYHALDQRVVQLPLAAFDDRPELRAELLSSLTQTQVGLIELAAATMLLGTPAGDARLTKAANAVRNGHALGLKVTKALGLPP
jgi:hypothetical protein